MGQTITTHAGKVLDGDRDQQLESLQIIRGEVVHHSKRILAAAVCDYDEFIERINELNGLCSRLTSNCGKRLLFSVKKGTDETVLWRATVRICVAHWDIATAKVVSSRLLNLPQFLHIFSTIESQFVALLPDTVRRESIDENSTSSASYASPTRNEVTFSLLLDRMLHLDDDTPDKLNECCICLERKPDTMLPCAHAYCLPCIEQWNTEHKSCPVCRVEIKSTDDGWVIPEVPEAEDITRELCSSLMNLASEPDH